MIRVMIKARGMGWTCSMYVEIRITIHNLVQKPG